MSEIVAEKFLIVERKEHRGQQGLLVQFNNPASEANCIPREALEEIYTVLEEHEGDKRLTFILLYEKSRRIHAGADISLFAGDINPQAVLEYLMAGARLAFKFKEVSKKIRTVSVMEGERYGGSVELPLMAEYSICAPGTHIQFSEVNLGIIPGWAGIANLMLRSNRENALYLAATGERMDAQKMLAAGIVCEIQLEESLLDSALDLGVSGEISPPGRIKTFMTRSELESKVALRSDSRRYQVLASEVREKLEKGALQNEKKLENYAGKYIQERLMELGRPVAPLAVKAVFQLVDRFSNIDFKKPDAVREMIFQEGELCFDLMNTEDRKTGIHSILTENLLEKIPLFIGK